MTREAWPRVHTGQGIELRDMNMISPDREALFVKHHRNAEWECINQDSFNGRPEICYGVPSWIDMTEMPQPLYDVGDIVVDAFNIENSPSLIASVYCKAFYSSQYTIPETYTKALVQCAIVYRMHDGRNISEAAIVGIIHI